MPSINIAKAVTMIFFIWKKTEATERAHSRHIFSPTANFQRPVPQPTVESTEIKITNIRKVYRELVKARVLRLVWFSPKYSSHLTCRLVSCCCWWAMVCFTNTLLILCSMAYFFAWKIQTHRILTNVLRYYVYLCFNGSCEEVLFSPRITYPLQCLLLLRGEWRKAKLGACALSILHRQSFTTLQSRKQEG